MSFKLNKLLRIFYIIKSNKKAYRILGFLFLITLLLVPIFLYLSYLVIASLFSKVSVEMPSTTAALKNIPTDLSSLDKFIVEKSDWFMSIFNKYSSLFDVASIF